MNQLVYQYLNSYNHIEIEQLKTGSYVPNFAKNEFHSGSIMEISESQFLKKDPIYISKHSRFADYPEHTHKYLEINYVLNGECIQNINGNEEFLEKGDVLLINQGTYHSIKALRSQDLLINLMFKSNAIDSSWFKNLPEKENFLLDYLVDNTKKTKNDYVIFKGKSNPSISKIMDEILDKNYTRKLFSSDIILHYISILFMELISNTEYRNSHYVFKNNEIIVKILDLINQQYATLTLESLANKLSYNKNYLSNLIKKKTNKTFSQIILDTRLDQALFLLQHSNLTISEIQEKIGIENKSFFYKKFRERFANTPSKLRSFSLKDTVIEPKL